jgi:hypothetical protein
VSASNNPNRDEPGNGEPKIGQRIDEAIELIQMELRHAIDYINDAVIPQVRRESIQGLRAAAGTLRNLADRFEREANASAGGQAAGNDQNPPGARRS